MQQASSLLYVVIRLHRHSLQLSVAAILNVKQGAQLPLHLFKKTMAVVRHDPVVSNLAGLVDVGPVGFEGGT